MRTLRIYIAIVLLGVFVGPAAARADEVVPSPHFVMSYQQASSAQSDSPRFMYPATGFLLDHPVVHFEFESSAGFMIVDGFIALIKFLAGNDSGLPLFNLLNGEDPGSIQLWYSNLRIAAIRGRDVTHFGGLSADFNILNMNYPEFGDDGVGALAGNIGPTFSTRVQDERADVIGTLELGTGIIAQNAWNPYAGVRVTGRHFFTESVGVLVRLRYRVQDWDFRGEDDTSGVADPPVTDVIHFWGFEAGLALRFDD